MPNATMKSARVRQVEVPLSLPVVSRVGSFDKWPIILIEIEMSDGIVGLSYLEPYLRHSARYIVPAIYDLVDRFKDHPIGPAEFFDQARKSLSLIGFEGVSQIAISGVDMALWDAAAKRVNLPLAEYLGGSIGQVAAYNSNGLWLSEPSSQSAEATLLVQQGGFNALKLRLGRDDLTDDLAAIDNVRKSVGQHTLLMVDFNQGLTYDKAVRRCRELDELGIYWFEEPVSCDQFDSYRELRRRLKTPIQMGENFYGPNVAANAISRGVSDMIMPDMMRIGGVTGWMRTAAIASANGVPMSSHLYPEISAHLLRVTPTAHWLEWQDWANPILERPFEVADGLIRVPDRPGIGVTWNESAVKEYAYQL